MRKTKLLACPFCGSQPVLLRQGLHFVGDKKTTIICKCGASMTCGTEQTTKRKWNRRVNENANL